MHTPAQATRRSDVRTIDGGKANLTDEIRDHNDASFFTFSVALAPTLATPPISGLRVEITSNNEVRTSGSLTRALRMM